MKQDDLHLRAKPLEMSKRLGILETSGSQLSCAWSGQGKYTGVSEQAGTKSLCLVEPNVFEA